MLALTNAKIMTVACGTLERGIILIDAGRIVAVGEALEIPEDARRMDVTGKVITPGLIDAHTHVGLSGDSVGREHSDSNETSDPITPHMRALDAVDPLSPEFQDLLEAGITTVLTGPGSANLIGGQWVCLKTAPQANLAEMVLLEPAGMKMALGENPKHAYGNHKKAPASRMGNAALLRSALVEAQNYMATWDRYEHESIAYRAKTAWGTEASEPTPPARDIKLEALVSVLRREMKCRIHAHQTNDILTAIRIAEEFNLDITIEHATEGYLVADLLAAKGIPVTVGPIFTGRYKHELRSKHHKNPGILCRAGVKVALQVDGASSTQYLAFSAALAVRGGMPEDEALKAITLNAAEIIGVADRVGSLEPGKDADLVVFSGHPFDYRTQVELVFVNGAMVYAAGGEGVSSCR
ncbi:MAG: amidohydrolase [Anaerolineae bacterium]|nr:amidohydrolase [Anaerolineae bacterium]